MLACRTPRGSIFAVASRDYLLLALTNQPSAALWESSSLWHSFGNINVPSSQAVLWLRTAIAVFFRKTSDNIWGLFLLKIITNLGCTRHSINKFILCPHLHELCGIVVASGTWTVRRILMVFSWMLLSLILLLGHVDKVIGFLISTTIWEETCCWGLVPKKSQ